jgi:hypothetical protein
MSSFLSNPVFYYQYWFSILNPIDECKDYYTLTYFFKGKKYKKVLQIIPSKRPLKVFLITDKHGKDVTDIVTEYLGPSKKFNDGINLTPNMMGFSFIKITLFTDDEPLVFKDDEVIIV